MIIEQLKSMKVAPIAPNHTILTLGSVRVLLSYESVIAVIDNGQVYLGKNWKYSVTTSKYRNQFLGEDTKTTKAKLEAGLYKLLLAADVQKATASLCPPLHTDYTIVSNLNQ